MAHQGTGAPSPTSPQPDWLLSRERARPRSFFSAVTNALANVTQTASYEFERICESMGWHSRDTDGHDGPALQTCEDGNSSGKSSSSKRFYPTPIYGRVIPDQGRRRRIRDVEIQTEDLLVAEPSTPLKRTRRSGSEDRFERPVPKLERPVPKRKRLTLRARSSSSATSTPLQSPLPTPSPMKLTSPVDPEEERMARLERNVQKIQAKMADLVSQPDSPQRPPRTVRFSSVTSMSYDSDTPFPLSPVSVRPLSTPPPVPLTSPTTPTTPTTPATPRSPGTPSAPLPIAISPTAVDYRNELLNPALVRANYRQHHCIPDDKHKDTMKVIVAQIPKVLLKRTDTICDPDGSLRPNPFWNEIYNGCQTEKLHSPKKEISEEPRPTINWRKPGITATRSLDN